jgi:transposase
MDGPFEVPQILVYTLSLLLRSRINNVRTTLVSANQCIPSRIKSKLKRVKQQISQLRATV